MGVFAPTFHEMGGTLSCDERALAVGRLVVTNKPPLHHNRELIVSYSCSRALEALGITLGLLILTRSTRSKMFQSVKIRWHFQNGLDFRIAMGLMSRDGDPRFVYRSRCPGSVLRARFRWQERDIHYYFDLGPRIMQKPVDRLPSMMEFLFDWVTSFFLELGAMSSSEQKNVKAETKSVKDPCLCGGETTHDSHQNAELKPVVR